MNGLAFLAYIEHALVPDLQPADIVAMENLSTHKIVGVRRAIENACASLGYPPAYSPDPNPIEQAFPKSPVTAPLVTEHSELEISDL